MNKFDNVSNLALRAWNQLHYAMQLDESNKGTTSEDYFASLTKAEQMNVLAIGARIAAKGRDFVHKEVINYEG